MFSLESLLGRSIGRIPYAAGEYPAWFSGPSIPLWGLWHDGQCIPFYGWMSGGLSSSRILTVFSGRPRWRGGVILPCLRQSRSLIPLPPHPAGGFLHQGQLGFWVSAVTGLPATVLAKPHWGLTARRSSGICRKAASKKWAQQETRRNSPSLSVAKPGASRRATKGGDFSLHGVGENWGDGSFGARILPPPACGQAPESSSLRPAVRRPNPLPSGLRPGARILPPPRAVKQHRGGWKCFVFTMI